ncbi:S46 family peptidase [Bacteroides fluxus]|uniref:S46 family peptidase n=1 Tax=Bacteroides fluxus TaxID=626930 RepID=UPI00235240BF|nr:S46 family peptidase [Bacteroides fluxus]
MKQILTFLAILVGLQIKADEGMWAIHNFHHIVPDSPICFYSTNGPSLKDAVVAIGEGGSGSFISRTGLVLTNLHVIKSLIAKDNEAEKVLTNGFCSSPAIPELKLEGLYLKILVRTIDVSAEISQGLSKGQKWSSLVKETCLRYKPIEEDNRQEIKREFFGANHFLHEYAIIKDVRLVYCPPQTMASYGGDTANWHWPRMSADFAILRVYIKGNGEKSLPFSPKLYLKISENAITPGEKVYVLGYPRGTSYDWISADAHESFLLSMIRRTEVLGLRMSVINRNIHRLSAGDRIPWERYVSSLNNERLKNLGRVSGFLRYMILEKLIAKEDSCGLLLRQNERDKYQEFCVLRNKADSLVRLINPLLESDDDYRQSVQAIQSINSAGLVRNKKKFTDDILNLLVDKVFRTSNVVIEKAVTKELLAYLHNKNSVFTPMEIKQGKIGVNDYVDKIYKNSVLVEKDKVLSILSGNQSVKNDPAMMFLEYTDSIYESAVGQSLVTYANQLKVVREKILIMLHDCGFTNWSGTNGTLRVSYGKTGTQCWSTNLNKEICKAWANYGYQLRYDKSSDKQVVLNFTTDCHTTGGNSGSPVVNEYGELVGLNFDRKIDGLCGDYYYLPSVCQNICVSIDYIIKILSSKDNSKLILKELCI